jgi:hypothetical protein
LQIAVLTALDPPADAPMTMMWREGMENAKPGRRSLLIEPRHLQVVIF